MTKSPSGGTSSGTLNMLARGTSINLIGMVIRTGFIFLHSIVAARFYGAENYGVYAISLATVALISFIAQVGLGRTITKFVSMYWVRQEPGYIVGTLKRVLMIIFPASALLGLAVGFSAPMVGRLFSEPKLELMLRVLSFAIPMLTIATILAQFTQGFQRMRYRTISLDIVRPVTEFLALIGMLLWGSSAEVALSLPYLLSIMAATLLLIRFTHLDLQRLKEEFPNFSGVAVAPPLKPMLGFAAPLLVVDVLMSITARVSTLMLGAMGTSIMVGMFNVIERVVALGSSFLISTNVIFSSIVADLVERKDLRELARFYQLTARWVLIVSLPYLLILIFFGDLILSLYGPEFTQGKTALAYLAGAGLVNLATGSCGIILMMAGYPQYSAINEGLMLLLVVTLNILLIPGYGILGAVWAVSIGTITVNLLRVLQVWYHLRMHPFSHSLWKIAIAGVGTALFLELWRHSFLLAQSAWVMVIWGSLLSVVLFTLILLALRLEEEEIRLLRALPARRAALPSILRR